MTDKEQYLENQITLKNQFWIGKVLVIGSVLFPFIGIADYFVTPENFKRFLLYRFCITAIFIIAFFLNKLKRNNAYQYTIISTITILSAATVELMILSFGGHTSSYYAGINLIIITALSLIPFSLPLSIAVSVTIYGVYIIPILALDKITNVPVFVANNVFMISTFCIALTWRIFNQRTMLNELSLQYDLAQQKQQLERYSTQLEEVVKERTQELQASEQWHRSLSENATDGIIVLDEEGLIVNVNDKACRMHGFTKDTLVGTHISLLEFGPNRQDSAGRMNRILSGESLVYETVHNKKDGTSFHLEISAKAITIGERIFIQSFYRDTTEKKKMQDHLLQSQKMDSIGVLAGGIAHDFNNMLAAVLAHAEVIRRNAVLEPKAMRSLQVIEDVSKNTGSLISKLLGFARENAYEISPLNLNNVVYDTVKLLERIIDKNIDVRLELDNKLPIIQGDANQLEQVIMNLIVNARDAMPHGGKIVISTQYRTITKNMPNVPPYIKPGGYVQLSVADTGSGIPDDILQKIFEPFFTTKERGKGTGLGLSMAYGAIKEHKGHITVQSRVGAGSTFIVYLPVARELASPAARETSATLSGNEVILFVDDEENILTAVEDALTAQGYKVLATSNPSEALALFKKMSSEISLVITDMVMPKIDGRELIRQMHAIKPDMNILAISGYMKYVAEKEDIQDIAGFLQKPFQTRDLLVAIRRILDSSLKQPRSR